MITPHAIPNASFRSVLPYVNQVLQGTSLQLIVGLAQLHKPFAAHVMRLNCTKPWQLLHVQSLPSTSSVTVAPRRLGFSRVITAGEGRSANRSKWSQQSTEASVSLPKSPEALGTLQTSLNSADIVSTLHSQPPATHQPFASRAMLQCFTFGSVGMAGIPRHAASVCWHRSTDWDQSAASADSHAAGQDWSPSLCRIHWLWPRRFRKGGI